MKDREAWTPTSILVFLGSLLAALFVHFTALRTADRRAVADALAVVKEQTTRSDSQYREDKASANEWRSTLGDRDRDYMRRSDFRAVIATLLTVAAILVPLAIVLVRK
jgi:hypothetical protein